MISIECYWGERSRSETLQKQSDLSVEVTTELDGTIARVRIDLFGEAAHIPSLKNSKMPGRNFMSPDTRARIRVLDRLLENAKLSIPRFQTEVFVMLINAKRNRHFDLDNTFQTVKDWLEPKTKIVGRKGRSRGWGSGIVENDSLITGISLHAHLLDNTDPNCTSIIVVPYTKMKTSLLLMHRTICRNEHAVQKLN